MVKGMTEGTRVRGVKNCGEGAEVWELDGEGKTMGKNECNLVAVALEGVYNHYRHNR